MIHDYTWQKKGKVFKPEHEAPWWSSNAMAPAPVMYGNDTIRVYVGAWDENGISRIGYIDVDADDPLKVRNISRECVVDIGRDGCFDDNGVLPGHAFKHPDGRVFLYYTGFQQLHKIAFSNFSGLAVSTDGGDTFRKVSEAPVMDRADEGLYTRAGVSAIYEDGRFKCCYSVGSGWYTIAGKERPVYEVNYIESADGIHFGAKGESAVRVDLSREHGLGRPQIVSLRGETFVFYTRRTLDFKYSMGCARFSNGTWERCDEWLSSVRHGAPGEFDSEMVYFPAVIDTGRKIFLFYVGNGYGKEGFGCAELIRTETR